MPGIEPRCYPFAAMGTRCELRLYADDERSAAGAASAAIAEVRRIERAYSRYRSDSVVSAINEAGKQGGAISLSREAADLIDLAFDAYRLSDGLFDVTSGALREVWRDDIAEPPSSRQIAPVLARIGLHKVAWERPRLSFGRRGMQVDLGGIGKEYAADRAANACRRRGISAGLVDLGGDIVAIGPHPDGTSWRIGVRDPRDPESALATLFLARGGVATSGDYERFWEFDGRRYGHIFDPRTGWPVRGLSSVTVAASTCLRAGLYSTIAMLKGEDGAQWLEEVAAPHVHVDAASRVGGSLLSPSGDFRSAA
ncbi:MAG: FAD:protein FMN transferase [Roseiarcus sp.]